jgi:serine/threonine protein kinase
VPTTAEVYASDAVFSYSDVINAKTKTNLSFSPDLYFPKVGQRFLGFDLIGELGSGTFGRVYLAKQPAIGDRLVALKVASDIGGECHALAQLRHTNIVPVYSVHDDPLQPNWKALCMPFLGGTTLQSILGELQSNGTPHRGSAMAASWRKLKTTVRNHVEETLIKPAFRGAPPSSIEKAPTKKSRLTRALTTFERIEAESFVDAVLEIAAALADGLAHAHDQGILHRDLKPANVIITDDGEPMLVDFNLSEDVKQRSESLWSMAGGTLPYMSPEQIDEYLRRPAEVDQRSDLYSLGVIIHELLTGKLPFPSLPTGVNAWDEARAARKQPAPSARALNGAVNRRVEVILHKCLAGDPAERYQTARSLHEDLKHCLAGRPLVHARDPYLHERVGQWAERNATKLFAGGLAAFATLCAFSVYSLHEFEARRDATTTWAAVRPQMERKRFELAEAVIDRKGMDQLRAKAIELLTAFDDGGVLESNRRFKRLGDDEKTELRRRATELAALAAGASLIEAAAYDGDERRQRVEDAERWTARVEKFVGPGSRWKSVALLKGSLAEFHANPGADRLRRDAEAMEPFDPTDRQLAALVLTMQRRFGAAKELIAESSDSPDELMDAFLAGFCLRELGEVSQAVKAWEACARERPTTPQFRRLLGLMLNRFQTSNARNLYAPLRNLDAAVAMDATDLESLLARAAIYKALRKFPDAIHDVRDAIRLGCSPYYAWSALARLAKSNPSPTEDDKNTITQALSERERIEPKTLNDWLELANYGSTAEERLSACEKALAERPWSIEANAELLEQLLAARIADERATKAIGRARAVAPDLWKMRMLCGRLYAIQGNEDEAFREIDEILARSNFLNQRLSAATAVVIELAKRDPAQLNRLSERLTRSLYDREFSIAEWKEAVDGGLVKVAGELAAAKETAEISRRLTEAAAAITQQ